MRLVNQSKHVNNGSYIFPKFYETKNHIYINGKVYRKDFSLDRLSESDIYVTKSEYENCMKYALHPMQQYSNVVYEGEYNDRDSFDYSDGNHVIHCSNGTYFKITTALQTSRIMITKFNECDSVEKSISYHTTSNRLRHAEFIGQDENNIYFKVVNNDNYCTSRILYIDKNLNNSVKLASNGDLTYSTGLQKLYENDSVIIVSRSVTRNGDFFIDAITKTPTPTVVRFKDETRIMPESGRIFVLNQGFYKNYKNNTLTVYSLTYNSSELTNRFNILYKTISIDDIENGNYIVLQKGNCVIDNFDHDVTLGQIYNYFNTYNFIFKIFVHEEYGTDILSLYTCSIGEHRIENNAIVNFTILDDNHLKYIGYKNIHKTSSFPIITNTNVLYVPTENGIDKYMLDKDSLLYSIVDTIHIVPRSVAVFECNSILILDKDCNIHLLDDSLPYTVKTRVSTTTLVYEGAVIESTVSVCIYNHHNACINGTVELYIKGNAIFADNTKVQRIDITNKSCANIPFFVTGGGVVEFSSTLII